ncbi:MULTISPECIES: M14 family zinc carboxypeptidase [unclassified Nocardia]|uniref:M14 family zinc carboxypeptidase n=1 Tax=unclassified Nocardia TaxID=2637762 RepID=UPI001CE47FC5|nr:MULTISPECIES: M14 family zinc carboxypeptidase [unclassified Nocardia]
MTGLDEVGRIAGSVDRIGSFPTVDELNAYIDELALAYPHRVAVAEIGTSRNGDPIRSVRVGSGERRIAVFGNPHPNEPIGMATIRHLLGRMIADEALTLGATWYFVPCVDPDGTRLNEGWFAGPLTRTRLAREFYRPPVTEQPEWAFPVAWRGATVGAPLPETRALMTLIDEIRPALIASLHNSDFGGGFFYTSGGDESYWAELTELLTVSGIPVHGGDPDAPGAKRWTTGVYQVPTFETMAETLVAAGVEPVAALGGGGCRDYGAKYGAAVLVCEVPLFLDPRITDDTPTDRVLREVNAECAAAYRELARVGGAVLVGVAAELTGASPFERAARAMVTALPGIAEVKEAAPDQDRFATRGEAFTEEYSWLGMFRLRLGGLLLRLLDGLIAEGSAAAVAERARFGAIFDGWCAEIERRAPGEPVPVERLVAIQAGAIVTAALRLRDGLPI